MKSPFDVVMSYAETPATEEMLQDAMRWVAAVVGNLPIGQGEVRLDVGTLTPLQARALVEHEAAGRLDYYSIDDCEPGVIHVHPYLSLDEWYCQQLDKAGTKPDDSGDWLTPAQVARGLGWYLNSGRGKKERPDSPKVLRLELDSEGEKRTKRIKRQAVMAYCELKGLEWNEKKAKGKRRRSMDL